MNSILKAAFLVFAFWAGSASAGQVGVSIHLGDPGYYGRIDIGLVPLPRLVHAQPVIVGRPVAYGAPVYLRVPPGHMNKWSKHCGYYQACGMPVYFVQDHWYDTVYVPAYRERHGRYVRYDRHDRRHSHDRRDRHHDRGHRRDHDCRNDGRGHGRRHND